MARPSVADALGFGSRRDSIDTARLKGRGSSISSDKGRDGDVRGDEGEGRDFDEDGEDDLNILGSRTVHAEVEASLRRLRYGGEGSGREGEGVKTCDGEIDRGGSGDGDGAMRLMGLIDRISLATDLRLLALLENRFRLTTHLLALKKFMLLGQVRRATIICCSLSMC